LLLKFPHGKRSEMREKGGLEKLKNPVRWKQYTRKREGDPGVKRKGEDRGSGVLRRSGASRGRLSILGNFILGWEKFKKKKK